MIKITSVFAAALIGIAGCTAQIPLPTAHEVSMQPKVLAAEHWNELAMNIAGRLHEALAADGSDPVLFVRRPSSSTKFYSSFHELLETQLLQQGFGVTRAAGGADLEVEYGVKHGGVADMAAQSATSSVVAADDDIVITIAVVNGDRYVTRINEIFYVLDGTHGEYFAAAPPVAGRLIQVTGE